MSDLFYPTEYQLARIQPYFPKPHGVPRVDDLRVLSGIIHVLKRGLQWRDTVAPGSNQDVASVNDRIGGEGESIPTHQTAIHFR